MSHHRGYYKWASHLVHADSKSLRLSIVSRGGSSAVLTNATNAMLSDPGQHSLQSLFRVFVSMVTSAEPFSFYDQLICESLDHLLDKAGKHLVHAETAVEEAEERLQAELAEQGKLFDLVHGEMPLDEPDHES